MTLRAMPSAALAEMLARDGELDRILSGRGLAFAPAVTVGPPPPPPGPSIRELMAMDPVDWYAEQAAAEARARARAPVRAVEPPLVEEDTEAQPAKPKPRSATPRIDEVKEWRREQLAADRGQQP